MLSFGNPEPFGIRVWSTLNSPGPFSIAMMAGLILLFTAKSKMRYVAAAVGYVSLLLSLDRTAWGAWGLAFIIFLALMRTAKKIRIIVLSVVIGFAVFTIAASPPFADIITPRLQTLSDIKGDGSFSERVDIYNRGIGPAVYQFYGYGLGREAHKDIFDSGILDMLLTLGWPGTILYLTGLFGLIALTMTYKEGRADLVLNASRAISVAIVATMIFSDALLQVTGVILWGLLGLAIAGHEFHSAKGFVEPD